MVKIQVTRVTKPTEHHQLSWKGKEVERVTDAELLSQPATHSQSRTNPLEHLHLASQNAAHRHQQATAAVSE